jgi:hypothetical protein
MDSELVTSALNTQITRDGITVTIAIHRMSDEADWVLEVEDHLGGSTVWEERFPTERAALDEAMRIIEEEGVGSFATAS